MAWATEAFRPVNGLITPRLFGPMTRIRPRPAWSMIRRSSAAPSAPISLNPAEATMAARTPASTHSPIRSGTVGAGVATMARSTRSGTAPMRGWALIPSTLRRFGLTGKMGPPNGLFIRFHTIVRPMLPAFSVAPMTAMFWGVKNASKPPLPLVPSDLDARSSAGRPLAVLMGPSPQQEQGIFDLFSALMRIGNGGRVRRGRLAHRVGGTAAPDCAQLIFLSDPDQKGWPEPFGDRLCGS